MNSRYDFPNEQITILFLSNEEFECNYHISQLDDSVYFGDGDKDWEDVHGFVVTLYDDGESVLESVHYPERRSGGKPMSSKDMKKIEDIADKCADHYDAYVKKHRVSFDAQDFFDESVRSQVKSEVEDVGIDTSDKVLFERFLALVDGNFFKIERSWDGAIPPWSVKARASVSPPGGKWRFPVELDIQRKQSCEEALLTACVMIERWRENPANSWTIKEFDNIEARERNNSRV